MFELFGTDFMKTKPTFYYEDSAGNKAKVMKNEGYFVIRVNPNDDKLKIHGIRVDVPVPKDFEGVHLKVDVEPDVDMESPEVKVLLEDINTLINRWISICYDINLLSAKPQWFHMEDGSTASEETVNQYKLERLSIYPELAGIIEKLFSTKH